MKHTKGPWTLVGKTICDADGDSTIEVLSGLTADLKLAAAAPEILAALIRARAKIVEMSNQLGRDPNAQVDAVVSEGTLDALIARARGEA